MSIIIQQTRPTGTSTQKTLYEKKIKKFNEIETELQKTIDDQTVEQAVKDVSGTLKTFNNKFVGFLEKCKKDTEVDLGIRSNMRKKHKELQDDIKAVDVAMKIEDAGFYMMEDEDPLNVNAMDTSDADKDEKDEEDEYNRIPT